MNAQRFATDTALLAIANQVFLQPPHDRAVFYAENAGERLAQDFVRQNPGYARIDDLLLVTPEGRDLFKEIDSMGGRRWDQREEIWLALSMRLAMAASGIVNCFGPVRLLADEPVESARHGFRRNAFVNTQFEKAELPILENNLRVTQILYNGQPLD